MHRCLELAKKGKGYVAPNPMVGAVIVYQGKIIGEGYHRRYGEPHAEVNAVTSVKDHSLLKESVMYVNLEPCSHFGKTPPCAQMIIEKKIPVVCIGNSDPYPKVSGRGVKMLEEAGVKVFLGILKEDCEKLNKRFLTFYREKRPFITLKWAQSSDGFIDRSREPGDNQQAFQFSEGLTRMLVHKSRSEEAAIMVGTRTALLDNPSLTVRYWSGKNPLRIVLDRNLVIPEENHLLDGKVSTLVFTSKIKESRPNLEFCPIDFDQNIIIQILDILYEKKIQSLFVEGGAMLLNAFIQSDLWDEVHVETLPVRLESGVEAPFLGKFPDRTFKCKKSIISLYSNNILPKIL